MGAGWFMGVMHMLFGCLYPDNQAGRVDIMRFLPGGRVY